VIGDCDAHDSERAGVEHAKQSIRREVKREDRYQPGRATVMAPRRKACLLLDADTTLFYGGSWQEEEGG
jgi:hypothetical protein